jgi:hypothetical protein
MARAQTSYDLRVCPSALIHCLPSHHFDVYPSSTRSVELDQVDALPATQQQSAFLDRQELGRTDERRLKMGWGVALGVTVFRAGWRYPIQSYPQVVLHTGIPVFVQRDSGRRMRAEHEAHTVLHAGTVDNALHSVRDVVEGLSPSG